MLWRETVLKSVRQQRHDVGRVLPASPFFCFGVIAALFLRLFVALFRFAHDGILVSISEYRCCLQYRPMAAAAGFSRFNAAIDMPRWLSETRRQRIFFAAVDLKCSGQ